MSLDAMTNRAVEDRIWRQPEVEIVTEAFSERKALAKTDGAVTRAADTILTYIPTEIVTVYVAAVAAINTPGTRPATGQWTLLAALLVLTPLTTWALFAARLRAVGEALPIGLRSWPWLNMTVASIAFVLWAFALPNTPFEETRWYTPGLAAVVLLVGTMILGLATPFFRSPRSSP